jgi:hypothetical protein
MLEEFKYKLNTLLESRVYKRLLNDPTAEDEGKYRNSLPNIKLLILKWTLDKNAAKM